MVSKFDKYNKFGLNQRTDLNSDKVKFKKAGNFIVSALFSKQVIACWCHLQN